MRVFPVDLAANGWLATPVELNHELENLVGVFNGRMDRDNIPNDTLTAATFELDAFNVIDRDQTATVRDVVHTEYHLKQQWTPIPDSSGNPWLRTITTPDCALQITLNANAEHYIDGIEEDERLRIALGVFVNGQLAGMTGIPFGMQALTLNLDASWPVGAGTHIIQPVYTLHENVRSRWGAAATATVRWHGRSIWTRGCCR